MPRDIPITVRISESLNDFLSRQAKRDERPQAQLMYLIIKEWAVSHGFDENQVKETLTQISQK